MRQEDRNPEHKVTLSKCLATGVLPKDGYVISGLRSIGRFLALEQGGCPRCQDSGGGEGGRSLEDVHVVPQRAQGPRSASASPGQERWVCPTPYVHSSSPFEPLAEDQAPGPGTEGPLCRPLPARTPGPCFLFILYCRDSMGRNSAPCPTVVTQTSILHRGSQDAPPRRGRDKGCYKELIVCWGPGSEQGLGRGGQEPT